MLSIKDRITRSNHGIDLSFPSEPAGVQAREKEDFMAQRVVTERTDDIDGSEAVDTVTFGYRGKRYEIDLGQKNLDRLEKALAPFIEHGRTVRATDGRQRRRGGGARGTARASDTKAIREWARRQGLQVSERGRIPAEIVERYEREAS
jgi:Lsr2